MKKHKTYKKLNIDEIKKNYNSKGFVIVKNFFSNYELRKIDQTLKTLILKISKDKKFHDIKNLNTEKFTKLYFELKNNKPKIAGAIYDSIQISSYLQSLLTSKKVIYLIKNFLNVEETNILNFFRTMRLDLPKKNHHLLSWHQDFMHSNSRELNYNKGVTIWAPLIQVSEALGSMKICVSSHKKRFKIKLQKRTNNNASEYLTIESKKLNNFKKQVINCSRGDVVFMNMNCVHSSVQGKSNLIRRTIISRYIDVDSEGFIPGSSKFTPSI